MTVSGSPGYRVRTVGTLAGEDEPPADELATGGGAPQPPQSPQSPHDSQRPQRPQRPHRWRASARRAPGLALVATLGVAGTAGFGTAFALRGSGSPSPAITGAARNLVLALTNFDPGTVGADFAQIQKDATGTFAGQAHRFFGASIRKELTSADAASRGRIEDLYVQSVTGGHATVFAVVSQRYLNKAAGAPVDDTLRLVLDMTDVHGTWKTSSVEVLQQPVAVGAAVGSGSLPATGSTSSPHHARSSSTKS